MTGPCGPLDLSEVSYLGALCQVGTGARQLTKPYGCPGVGIEEWYVGIGIFIEYGVVILFELHGPGDAQLIIQYSGVKKRYFLEDRANCID